MENSKMQKPSGERILMKEGYWRWLVRHNAQPSITGVKAMGHPKKMCLPDPPERGQSLQSLQADSFIQQVEMLCKWTKTSSKSTRETCLLRGPWEEERNPRWLNNHPPPAALSASWFSQSMSSRSGTALLTLADILSTHPRFWWAAKHWLLLLMAVMSYLQ